MREIKFRAWIRCGEWDDDGEKRKFEMIDGDSLAFEEYLPLCDLLLDKDDEAYYMQFTGLKDKNGKDIYEGDIAEWHGGGEAGIKRGEVIFQQGRFLITGYWLGFLFEIIGNIYENPDLLTTPQPTT